MDQVHTGETDAPPSPIGDGLEKLKDGGAARVCWVQGEEEEDHAEAALFTRLNRGAGESGVAGGGET